LKDNSLPGFSPLLPDTIARNIAESLAIVSKLDDDGRVR
jgi:hypothetical protein